MKTAMTTGALVAALFAAPGLAFETLKQQSSTNLAQAAVQHAVTVITGELEPCRDDDNNLIVCPPGQFVYRQANDENLNCPCRYQMENCNNEFEEWNILTGECVCVQRECLRDNHSWDFNTCSCQCDAEHECADGKVWDRANCACICLPPPVADWPAGETWNCSTCEFECIIQACAQGETWDQESCACICTPFACPVGKEFVDCECRCAHEDCPRGQYFDSNTCKCLCEPYECPPTYRFNTEVCACQCSEPDGADACEAGYYWNNAACRCECDGSTQCNQGYYLDDECECKCAPEACNADEIWNEELCACVCCPKHCPDNFYWSSTDCECQCAPIECATGFAWNQDHCHCDCVPTDCNPANNNNYYFDATECKCKCYDKIGGCDESDVFDTEICECICEPQACPAGQTWSREHCDCVCAPRVCPTSQYWRTDVSDPDNCGCFCHPHFCASGYHWDEDICNCVCSPPTGDYACISGSYWDSISCRCRLVPQECDADEVWDALDGVCKCVGTCQGGYYFDNVTCSCLCAPDSCDDGHYWDTRTCACKEEHCACPVGFYFNVDIEDCACLPQLCAPGMTWDSEKCSCVHEYQVCEQDPSSPNVFYFWCNDSGHCRCMFTGTLDENEYFDMEDCEVKTKHTCPENHFWNGEECECVFKAPYANAATGRIMTWNTEKCAYVCEPQTCHDDTYYWDAQHCKCACYKQTCPEGHFWDKNACRCRCSGIPPVVKLDQSGNEYTVYECPCGKVWDEECCMCKTCVDQGNCAEGTFFNPNTCRCTCLPECCDDGFTWSYESCTCEPDNYVCSEADGVYEWFQSIDAEWEASVSAFFGEVTLALVKSLSVEDIVGLGLTCNSLPGSKDPAIGSTQIQDPNNPCKCFLPSQCPNCNLTPTVDCPNITYDWTDPECQPFFSGGLHFVGCNMWIASGADGDWFQQNPEAEALYPVDGDVCLLEGAMYDVTSDYFGDSLNSNFVGYVWAENPDGTIYLFMNTADSTILFTPDYWRFYEDKLWLQTNNKAVMDQVEIPLHYPSGPVTNGDALNWSWDGSGLAAPIEGRLFNQPGDEYYMRVGHDTRLRLGCPESFFGISAASAAECLASDGPDHKIDLELVGPESALMLKFKLHTMTNKLEGDCVDDEVLDDCDCAYWTIQIAEGPCEGYYIDQNMGAPVTDFLGNPLYIENPSTKWSKTRDQFGIMFDNNPMTRDDVNAWNADNTAENRIFYQPFYSNGRFQVPRWFMFNLGSGIQQEDIDLDAPFGAYTYAGPDTAPDLFAVGNRYCWCTDGACDRDAWAIGMEAGSGL